MPTETHIADDVEQRAAESSTHQQPDDRVSRVSTARSLLEYLEHGPRWQGDDLGECLAATIAARGEAEF